MAAAEATADRKIVSLILYFLSDQTYKYRRQISSDHPVEFLEFRPTLIPSILTSKLWAELGTSILWRRYPHLPALAGMRPERRQWYADKVERAFVSAPEDDNVDLSYLGGLGWPLLKVLEMEVNWQHHGLHLAGLLHEDLEHLELSSPQAGGSNYIVESILPVVFDGCKRLQSLHLGHDLIDQEDPIHNRVLGDILDSSPSVKELRLMNTAIFGKNLLFARLGQRSGLEALEIDLDPDLALLPLFAQVDPHVSRFASLTNLRIVCYPEIALALPNHMRCIRDLHIDIARIPDHRSQDSDTNILDDFIIVVSGCKTLQTLRINVGLLASDFPSSSSHPSLSGTSLKKLGAGCPNLHTLNLSTVDPSAIDGSRISSVEFESFCRQAPRLRNLNLKFHPSTVTGLETTILSSLSTYCPSLEVLRIKAALHLPSLTSPNTGVTSTQVDLTAPKQPDLDDRTTSIPAITVNMYDRTDSPHSEIFPDSTYSPPLFPNMKHLGFSRPQNILSILHSDDASSDAFRNSRMIDPSLEEDLVRTWAQYLLMNFPLLDVLEAWGDWASADHTSLNYFLPLSEPLASTWEFLSGIEQDLWEDGDEQDEILSDAKHSDGDFEEESSFHSCTSDDWEKASLINEYPSIEHSIGAIHL